MISLGVAPLDKGTRVSFTLRHLLLNLLKVSSFFYGRRSRIKSVVGLTVAVYRVDLFYALGT